MPIGYGGGRHAGHRRVPGFVFQRRRRQAPVPVTPMSSTPPDQPLPNLACPLCGGPNDCAPAQCGRFDTDCWCNQERYRFTPELLEQVPEAQRRQACICRRCVEAAQA